MVSPDTGLPLGTILLGAACLYLLYRGLLINFIWLSVVSADSYRALRTIRPNGRRVGIATRQRVMREVLISWTVYAFLIKLEPILSSLLGWLPFYAPIRAIISLAFITIRHPASQVIYTNILRPNIKRYERPIDLCLLLIHALAAVIIEFTIAVPLHHLHNAVLRIRRATIGGFISSTIRDSHSGPDEAPSVHAADISLSTPPVPGRLRVKRRSSYARPISRAESGESSSPRRSTPLARSDLISCDSTCSQPSAPAEREAEREFCEPALCRLSKSTRNGAARVPSLYPDPSLGSLYPPLPTSISTTTSHAPDIDPPAESVSPPTDDDKSRLPSRPEADVARVSRPVPRQRTIKVLQETQSEPALSTTTPVQPAVRVVRKAPIPTQHTQAQSTSVRRDKPVGRHQTSAVVGLIDGHRSASRCGGNAENTVRAVRGDQSSRAAKREAPRGGEKESGVGGGGGGDAGVAKGKRTAPSSSLLEDKSQKRLRREEDGEPVRAEKRLKGEKASVGPGLGGAEGRGKKLLGGGASRVNGLAGARTSRARVGGTATVLTRASGKDRIAP